MAVVLESLLRCVVLVSGYLFGSWTLALPRASGCRVQREPAAEDAWDYLESVPFLSHGT